MKMELSNGNLNKLIRLTEEAEHESMKELLYKALLDASSAGVAVVSPSGIFIDVNKKYCELLGYAKKELIGITWQSITPEPSLSQDQKLVDACIDGKREGYILPKTYNDAEGKEVQSTIIVTAIRGEFKQLLSFLVLCFPFHPELINAG